MGYNDECDDGRFTQSWGYNSNASEPIICFYPWVAHEFGKLVEEGRLLESFNLRMAALKDCKYYLDTDHSQISREVYLEEVKPDTEEYAYFERLMEQSFPEEERPDRASLRQRMDNTLFHCFVIMDYPDRKPVGLITYWKFSNFVYIEHFAIDPSERGLGIGTSILYKLIWIHRYTHKSRHLPPIILEVEHPTTEVARCRIGFYERLGLELLPDKGYMQPAYRHGGPEVPMLLMSTPNLDPAKYEHMRDTLYREVYGVGKV